MSIYDELEIKKVVNCSGKMTYLGASILAPKVREAMIQASMNYVDMEKLMNRAGEVISNITGSEDACVTSSASAGIVISIAATMTKGNINLVEKLPNTQGMANKIILQKGHSISFGAPMEQMIRLAGGIPVEVGQVNKTKVCNIESAIDEMTAGMLYVKSHHSIQTDMVNLETFIRIGKKKNVPVIIDAAAEEDIECYIAMGADMVIYSGAKALGGPTSGFIAGKKEYIRYCRNQYKGIARPMKIGKENIVGLLKAIKEYKDIEKIKDLQIEKINYIVRELNDIEGLKSSISKDSAGREIYRAKIYVSKEKLGISAKNLAEQLEKSETPIYIRNHNVDLGVIELDPRPMKEKDEVIVVKKIKDIIQNNVK